MPDGPHVVVVTDWGVLAHAWTDALAPRQCKVVLHPSGEVPTCDSLVLHVDRVAEVAVYSLQARAKQIVWLHDDINPSIALQAKRAGVTALLHRSHGLTGLHDLLGGAPSHLVRHLGPIQSDAPSDLDMTQVSVLILLSRGLTMNEVAARLSMSMSSVQRTRRSALDALGVVSTSAAIARATELGLLVPVAGHTR